MLYAARLFAGSLGGLLATGGTGELNGANHSLFRGDEFETVEVELADLEGLAETEVVDVDDETLGDVFVEGFYFHLLHREGELTTGFHTFGVTFELYGNSHYNGLILGNLKEVDVEDVVFYRVELNLAENGHLFGTVVVELDSEDVGGIDELAHSLVGYSEVGGDDTAAILDFNEFLTGVESLCVGEGHDFAAVEHSGDFTFGAHCLGGLLAEICTGLGCKLESLHNKYVLLKN